MPDQSVDVTFGGMRLISEPNFYPLAAGRANSYWCPVGCSPGIGYVIVQTRSWQAKNAEAQAAAMTLSLGVGEVAPVTFPSLFVVSSQQVSGGVGGDPDSVTLLKFSDKRWQARLSDTARHFNVRVPAPSATSGADMYYEDSLDSGALWTWGRALEVLWGDCGSLGAWPGAPPVTPDGNPEGFSFVGVSAISALEALLSKCKMLLRYDPYTGVFTLVESGGPQGDWRAYATKFGTMLSTTQGGGPSSALVPATVRVYFPRRQKYYGTEPTDRDAAPSASWAVNYHEKVDVATGLGIPGTVLAVWDDLTAEVSFAGTIGNSAALSTRATERKNQLVGELTNGSARERIVVNGAISGLVPGSQAKLIHWRDFGKGWVTEICAFPGLPQSPEAASGIPQIDGDMAGCGLAGERLGPPDALKEHLLKFPGLLQLVALDGSGGALTAYATGRVWSGVVMRTDPGSTFSSAETPYESAEAIWIAMPNPLTGGHVSGMKLPAGDRYLARLNGFYVPDGGSVRPLYLIVRPENLIYKVTLSGTVTPGGSQSVTLSDGRTVTAFNSTTRPLPAGAAACYLDIPTSTFYLLSAPATDGGVMYAGTVSEVGGIAAGATGTISTSDGNVEATFWQNTGSVANNDKVFVFEDSGTNALFFIKSGGTSGTRMFYALLDADMHVADATGAIDSTSVFAVDGGAAPFISVADNGFGLAGENLSLVLLIEDATGESVVFSIIQVKHVRREPFTDLRYDTGAHEFQWKREPSSVMWDDDEDADWSGWHSGVDEVYVESVSLSGTTLKFTYATGWFLEPKTAGGDITILTVSQITVVADVDYNTGNHSLELKNRTAYVINPGGLSGWLPIHTMQLGIVVGDVVNGVGIEGSGGIVFNFAEHWVFEVGVDGTVVIPFDPVSMVNNVFEVTNQRQIQQSKTIGYVMQPLNIGASLVSQGVDCGAEAAAAVPQTQVDYGERSGVSDFTYYY